MRYAREGEHRIDARCDHDPFVVTERVGLVDRRSQRAVTDPVRHLTHPTAGMRVPSIGRDGDRDGDPVGHAAREQARREHQHERSTRESTQALSPGCSGHPSTSHLGPLDEYGPLP
jgi:hypothetical protein